VLVRLCVLREVFESVLEDGFGGVLGERMGLLLGGVGGVGGRMGGSEGGVGQVRGSWFGREGLLALEALVGDDVQRLLVEVVGELGRDSCT
jgi:hypothetical protein